MLLVVFIVIITVVIGYFLIIQPAQLERQRYLSKRNTPHKILRTTRKREDYSPEFLDATYSIHSGSPSPSRVISKRLHFLEEDAQGEEENNFFQGVLNNNRTPHVGDFQHLSRNQYRQGNLAAYDETGVPPNPHQQKLYLNDQTYLSGVVNRNRPPTSPLASLTTPRKKHNTEAYVNETNDRATRPPIVDAHLANTSQKATPILGVPSQAYPNQQQSQRQQYQKYQGTPRPNSAGNLHYQQQHQLHSFHQQNGYIPRASLEDNYMEKRVDMEEEDQRMDDDIPVDSMMDVDINARTPPSVKSMKSKKTPRSILRQKRPLSDSVQNSEKKKVVFREPNLKKQKLNLNRSEGEQKQKKGEKKSSVETKEQKKQQRKKDEKEVEERQNQRVEEEGQMQQKTNDKFFATNSDGSDTIKKNTRTSSSNGLRLKIEKPKPKLKISTPVPPKVKKGILSEEDIKNRDKRLKDFIAAGNSLEKVSNPPRTEDYEKKVDAPEQVENSQEGFNFPSESKSASEGKNSFSFDSQPSSSKTEEGKEKETTLGKTQSTNSGFTFDSSWEAEKQGENSSKSDTVQKSDSAFSFGDVPQENKTEISTTTSSDKPVVGDGATSNGGFSFGDDTWNKNDDKPSKMDKYEKPSGNEQQESKPEQTLGFTVSEESNFNNTAASNFSFGQSGENKINQDVGNQTQKESTPSFISFDAGNETNQASFSFNSSKEDTGNISFSQTQNHTNDQQTPNNSNLNSFTIDSSFNQKKDDLPSWDMNTLQQGSGTGDSSFGFPSSHVGTTEDSKTKSEPQQISSLSDSAPINSQPSFGATSSFAPVEFSFSDNSNANTSSGTSNIDFTSSMNGKGGFAADSQLSTQNNFQFDGVAGSNQSTNAINFESSSNSLQTPSFDSNQSFSLTGTNLPNFSFGDEKNVDTPSTTFGQTGGFTSFAPGNNQQSQSDPYQSNIFGNPFSSSSESFSQPQTASAPPPGSDAASQQEMSTRKIFKLRKRRQ